MAAEVLIASCLSLGFLTGCGEGDPEIGAAAETPATLAPWFEEVADLHTPPFVHGAFRGEADSPGDRYLMTHIMGSGGALFDYDADGDLDLYLIGAGSGERAVNRMYRRESDGSYTDQTLASGLGDDGFGMGAALGDVDNDGDLDLLVTNFGPDALYLNLGGGAFRRADVGLGSAAWSTSACFFDYDADGWLDLYVTTYVDFDPPRSCTDRSGHPEFCGPEAYRGVPDRLYRGLGGGRFEDVSERAFARRIPTRGLGVVCGDLDSDGRVEIYVANDGEPNQLWIQRRSDDAPTDIVFEDVALLMGAALNSFSRPEASMGVGLGDIDDDLDLDLFLTHLDRETNTLYENLGAAGFEDRTAASGLGPAGLPYTGFGIALADFDHDGDLDLTVVNGRVRRGASMAERAQRRPQVEPTVPPFLIDYAEPNLLFVNRGEGRFTIDSEPAGRFAATAEVSRGLLPGDFDGDGDIDLVLSNCGGPVRLYRNRAPELSAADHHWLIVRAIDPQLGRDALGATLVVKAAGRSLLRPVITTVSYLSAVEPEVHFGLREADRYDGIEVVWPDGRRESFPGGPADRRVAVLRGRGEPAS